MRNTLKKPSIHNKAIRFDLYRFVSSTQIQIKIDFKNNIVIDVSGNQLLDYFTWNNFQIHLTAYSIENNLYHMTFVGVCPNHNQLTHHIIHVISCAEHRSRRSYLFYWRQKSSPWINTYHIDITWDRDHPLLDKFGKLYNFTRKQSKPTILNHTISVRDNYIIMQDVNLGENYEIKQIQNIEDIIHLHQKENHLQMIIKPNWSINVADWITYHKSSYCVFSLEHHINKTILYLSRGNPRLEINKATSMEPICFDNSSIDCGTHIIYEARVVPSSQLLLYDIIYE